MNSLSEVNLYNDSLINYIENKYNTLFIPDLMSIERTFNSISEPLSKNIFGKKYYISTDSELKKISLIIQHIIYVSSKGRVKYSKFFIEPIENSTSVRIQITVSIPFLLFFKTSKKFSWEFKGISSKTFDLGKNDISFLNQLNDFASSGLHLYYLKCNPFWRKIGNDIMPYDMWFSECGYFALKQEELKEIQNQLKNYNFIENLYKLSLYDIKQQISIKIEDFTISDGLKVYNWKNNNIAPNLPKLENEFILSEYKLSHLLKVYFKNEQITSFRISNDYTSFQMLAYTAGYLTGLNICREKLQNINYQGTGNLVISSLLTMLNSELKNKQSSLRFFYLDIDGPFCFLTNKEFGIKLLNYFEGLKDLFVDELFQNEYLRQAYLIEKNFFYGIIFKPSQYISDYLPQKKANWNELFYNMIINNTAILHNTNIETSEFLDVCDKFFSYLLNDDNLLEFNRNASRIIDISILRKIIKHEQPNTFSDLTIIESEQIARKIIDGFIFLVESKANYPRNNNIFKFIEKCRINDWSNEDD